MTNQQNIIQEPTGLEGTDFQQLVEVRKQIMKVIIQNRTVEYPLDQKELRRKRKELETKRMFLAELEYNEAKRNLEIFLSED